MSGFGTAAPRYLASLLQAIGQSLLWPVRVYRARQTLHQLSRMDARELRDIGLTPYDVQSAQALPLDIDPTHAARQPRPASGPGTMHRRYY